MIAPIAWTLFRYLSLRTLVGIGIFFAALSCLVFLLDVVETLRIVTGKTDGGFMDAIAISLLRAPKLAEGLLPFVFLFGTMWAFSQLNRRSELVVLRASGLSVWRIIAPSLVVAALIGGIVIFAINPLSAKLMEQSERLRAGLFGQTGSLINFSATGLWLRQTSEGEDAIIHAEALDDDGALMKRVTVWFTDESDAFTKRIDAGQALLADSRLTLLDVAVSRSGEATEWRENFVIETPFSTEQLRESAAPPETMSVWELPSFINVAREAGFPVTRYELHWHQLTSTPAKLCAMVLIAAAFSMGHYRGGGAAGLVTLGVTAGFVLYILSDISDAFGESGLAPTSLAAWTPTIAATLFAATLLLHAEDG